MKKKLLIGTGCLVIILALVICLTVMMRNSSGQEDKRYALHLYGENFQYTRGIEAYYDQEGALKQIEVYLIYDSSSFAISNGSQDAAGKYPGAKSTCTVNDDGSVKISNFLTSESIAAGALTDNVFYMVNQIYDRIKTEADIKAFFEEQKAFAKENGIPADETNYIIMNGKQIKW
ncbi:MAG: hypothetical protein J1E00_08460 [Oscillospiraceae bacterium]|nr:hypothetical protein [Oscillospiraceae bacterium]